MNKHYWIFAVLSDVSDYAKLNGLDSLQTHIDAAYQAARTEFSEQSGSDWKDVAWEDQISP
jgi:hypothetical protein